MLKQEASEETFFNGVRDKGNAGMRLDDFMKLPQAQETGLTRAQCAALRLYTSHMFPAINNCLRLQNEDGSQKYPHPLPATVLLCNEGLKALRAWDAESDIATSEIILYRGFTDIRVSDEFQRKGGTEMAPMSTTTDIRIAAGYAVRKGQTDGALLLKIVTTNNLHRGADLAWLSMFPGEAETLFPPLTFLQCTGRQQVFACDGLQVTIVEVTTTVP